MPSSWLLSLVCPVLWACGGAEPVQPRGLSIELSALTLPGLSDACYDLRVTNAASGAGDIVWQRGTPGLNGGTSDAGAICADRFGDGEGDITWVGPCDASGQLDADPAAERINSVTLWVDGLYDDGGDYLDPNGPEGWRDPCPGGCTLDVLCEENADTAVRFDLTIMRQANQGFFDVAVAFEDIFCSAKLDTCYEGDRHIELLFGADQARDWTAVYGFACTAGGGNVDTTLHYGDLAIVCTGATTTVFPISPVGPTGNREVTVDGLTLHYGVYRGTEALSCDITGTPEVETCGKVYWNLAVSLDDLAPLGTCTLGFASTATDGGAGFVNGLPAGQGVMWPYIEVAATLSPPTCQRHALDDGGAVRTAYRGNLGGVLAPAAMCSGFDGADASPVVGADCNDSCPGDPDKTRPGLCGCGVPETDTDADGAPDCTDACDDDILKTAPGLCGCGVSDVDTDLDGTPDCTDECDNDIAKTSPGLCGCDELETDTDNDGAPDCTDECDNNGTKTVAGVCGCELPDIDTDTDGTLDCEDGCPDHTIKTAPGFCGCAMPDIDSDNDGSLDCNDECPSDPAKTVAGLCGCGVIDTADTDNDGTADCVDGCVSDPNKTSPGLCGCGVTDTASERLGGTASNPATTCTEIRDEGFACGDRTYWIDPDGGSIANAYEVFCDMTLDGGAWMKVESATWPFWFNDSTWTSYNVATPLADNYSILSERNRFVGVDGCWEYRLRVGDSGNWQSAISHTTAWRQCHDPFTQSTNGSDFTLLSGELPTTCGGFNGLHHKFTSNSYTSDPDLNDEVNCWWMQIVPKVQYVSPASYPGYLEGYGGVEHYHSWQSLWIRAAPEAPPSSCEGLRLQGETDDGTYWLDPNGGSPDDGYYVYCDMTETTGWTRVMGAAYPFFFDNSNWSSLALTTPSAANYSMLSRRALFESGGCTTYRIQVGDTGVWTDTPTHETQWRQCHDPFTQTTNGSDYTYLAGEAPTTCGGFNGLHIGGQGYAYTSDAASNDSPGCWWMQIVPRLRYDDFNGYLDGYGGSGTAHVWQTLWVK